MTRILAVDDEPAMRQVLQRNLEVRGYEVVLAADGDEAVALAAAAPPDLVILDLGLPGRSGIEVLRHLRTWTAVPVLILSARDTERDKVVALDQGADDYVTKPFAMGELLARVRAALRRTPSAGSERPVVTTPDFSLDLVAHTAMVHGEEVRLTPIEWRMVELMVRNPGRLVTQRRMLQEVWGPQYGEETHYLRVHLTHVRRKLEPDPSRPRYFRTEPGVGYRFDPGGDGER